MPKTCNFVTKHAKILDKSRERESIIGTVSIINVFVKCFGDTQAKGSSVMSEKQRKSSERNGMPKVLLAAGLSAAALTGCANGEAEPVETPKPTPTSITLETSEMQELNDTVKGLVMAGYEDMKNSVSPDEAADELTFGAYGDGSEAGAYIHGTDIMDWRKNDKNGNKRFRNDFLRIGVNSLDPDDYSRQLSEGFFVEASRSTETECLAYDPEDPTTAAYDEDRAGKCSDDEDNSITLSSVRFFNPDRSLLEQATADDKFTEEELRGVLFDENTKLVYARPAYLEGVIISGNEMKPLYAGTRLDKDHLAEFAKDAAATISDGWYH